MFDKSMENKLKKNQITNLEFCLSNSLNLFFVMKSYFLKWCLWFTNLKQPYEYKKKYFLLTEQTVQI